MKQHYISFHNKHEHFTKFGIIFTLHLVLKLKQMEDIYYISHTLRKTNAINNI